MKARVDGALRCESLAEPDPDPDPDLVLVAGDRRLLRAAAELHLAVADISGES